MLRTMLLAATSWLAGPSAVGIIGQAGGDGATPLTSLVFGALGSSPAALILAWMVTRADKEKAEMRADRDKDRAEIHRLNELRASDAKEMATLLERTATTLSDVRAGMDATITKAKPDEFNRALRDLRELLDERSRGERS